MNRTGSLVRSIRVGLIVVLLAVASCGKGDPSLTDYVENLNAMEAEFSPRGVALWTAYLALPNPTIEDLRALQDESLALRLDVEDTLDEVRAPEHLADMHGDWVGWHSRLVAAERALEARSETAGDIAEFLVSEELGAWAVVLGDGASLCADFEERLNSTEAADFFAGTAWMPSDLTAAVHAAIGCQNFPEDLDNVAALYRP